VVDDSKKARKNRKRFLKRYPNGDNMMAESEVWFVVHVNFLLSCHNNKCPWSSFSSLEVHRVASYGLQLAIFKVPLMV